MKPAMSGERSSVRPASDPLVIARTDDGFRVYAAADPSHVYHVTGTPHMWTCTCPDFRAGNGNGSRDCLHIGAVRVHGQSAIPGGNGQDGSRAVAQQSPTTDTDRSDRTTGAAQMVLKRSVSPDGRIDALSVEFACDVAQTSVGAIKAQALNTLQLQTDIVESFLARRKTADAAPQREKAEPRASDRSEPGELLSVAGMNGKWGRRLFITVQANGHTLKLFGTRQQLADAIVAAGFPDRAPTITEGVELRLPCRIVTVPSADGRFRNITQVLPAAPAGNGSAQS